VSLTQIADGAQALLVMWWCNHCPFVKHLKGAFPVTAVPSRPHMHAYTCSWMNLMQPKQKLHESRIARYYQVQYEDVEPTRAVAAPQVPTWASGYGRQRTMGRMLCQTRL